MISCFRLKTGSLWIFTISATVVIVLSSLYAQSQARGTTELCGTVRDGSDKPVVSATVILQAEGQTTPLLAQTDKGGQFSFQDLSQGTYALRVSAAGFAEASFKAISIVEGSKTFDVKLAALESGAASSSTAPQFFDQPQFTVSGMTDTTNLGGHGSGPVVRNREAVEKDVASLGGTSSVASSGSPANAYDLARSYANAGDYARARDQLQTLLAEHDTAEAHHLLASVDEKLGDSLDAVHEYERAAELDPSESNIFDWGSELLLHHAAEPAIEVFTNGNRLFPRSTRMLIGLGVAEFAAGSDERAFQRLCAASDLNPRDALPYLFMGKIERSENAVSAQVVGRLHRFLTLRPDNAQANYLYAVALWKQNGQNADAQVSARVESLLKNAVRRDPKFAEAYLQLGIVDASQGKAAAAISDFQHAIENQPDLEEAHYRLAQAYRASGKIEQAKAEIDVYQRLAQQSAQDKEREHREIKQFVYSLRDKPATPIQ